MNQAYVSRTRFPVRKDYTPLRETPPFSKGPGTERFYETWTSDRGKKSLRARRLRRHMEEFLYG